MPNLLIQCGKGLENDLVYEKLNHFDYKHYFFVNDSIRIDLFNYKNSKENNFYEDDKFVVGFLGYVIFKNEKNNTLEQLIELFYLKANIIEEIESGKFIILFYDKKRDKLLLFNDRFGLYPIFFCSRDDRIVVSTEPKGIIESSLNQDYKFVLDFSSFNDFLNYGYILDDKYFFKELKRIKPASKVVLQGSKIRFESYYREKWLFDKKSFDKDDLKRLNSLFRKGVNKLNQKYKFKSILPISGGYDSRYIYFNNSKVNNFLTFDKDSYEYRVVLKTISQSQRRRLKVMETRYSKKTISYIKKLFEIGDGLADISCTQVYQVGDFYLRAGYGAYWDGFAGDAILGGSYLSYVKELGAEFGLPFKYCSSDVERVGSFNFAILNKECRDKVLASRRSYNYSKDSKKNFFLFKWYNRGVNWLSFNSSVNNKRLHSFFPFFYYPFFDEYTKYSFDVLHCKKLYTYLWKSMNVDVRSVNDDFHVLSFRWPYRIRLLFSFFVQIFLKLRVFKINKITNYKEQFFVCDELKSFVLEKLLKSEIINEEELLKIFAKDIEIKRNQDYIFRVLNVCLFLEKYDCKIKNEYIYNHE